MSMAADVTVSARTTSFRWFVAGLIFLIYTIAAADRANIGFALPFIRNDFTMSNAEAGALLSLFAWGYALMQIPSGFAMSRLGVRRLFPGAMVLTSIFTGLVGWASSAFALKLVRFGLGIAEGPLPIGITTTINNWFPSREKGTASGLFLSAVKFGPVIVPPICAVIVSVWGWREIFYFCALPGLFLAVVWFLLVPDDPARSRFVSPGEAALVADNLPGRPTDPAAGQRPMRGLDAVIRARNCPQIASTGALFRSWDLWGCALGYAFQLGISNVLLAWIPTYLLTVKKFSVMGTGFVAAAPWVGAVVGNIVGGWMSDRLFDRRRKPGMLFSALATTGMMYALINAPADPTWYGLVLFATGMLLSIGFSAYTAYPMMRAAKPVFSVASSLVNMGGQFGGACAPLLVGLLLDSYGWNYVFGFMAFGSLVSFVIVATIKEPLALQISATQ